MPVSLRLDSEALLFPLYWIITFTVKSLAMSAGLDIIHYRTAKAKVKWFLFQCCYLVSIQVGQISRVEKGFFNPFFLWDRTDGILLKALKLVFCYVHLKQQDDRKHTSSSPVYWQGSVTNGSNNILYLLSINFTFQKKQWCSWWQSVSRRDGLWCPHL